MKRFGIILCLAFASLFGRDVAYAQEVDVACIGEQLDIYVNDLIDSAGSLSHVRLLSPAFNLNEVSPGIVANMNSATFNRLDGLAGNAYLLAGTTGPNYATTQIAAWRAATGLSQPIMITETGDYNSLGIDVLAPDFRRMRAGNTGVGGPYLGASLFNAFALNTSPDFDYGEYTDEQITHLCGGTCAGLGVNYAVDIAAGDPARASGLGLRFVVGLASIDRNNPSNSGNAVGSVINSMPAGIVPIIRVGTALDASGPTAAQYGQFVAAIDATINRLAYVIAGPNEPQTECWWDPTASCYNRECGTIPEEVERVERTIIGRVVSSKTFTDAVKQTTKTQVPVENATICVYQGAQTGSDGIGEAIHVFETSGSTNEDGYFAVDTFLRYRNPDNLDVGASYYGNNYMGVLCDGRIHEVFQVAMGALQKIPLSQKYYTGMKSTIVDKIAVRAGTVNPKYPRDYIFPINNEVLTPIELTLKCDPNPSAPAFTGSEEDPLWRQPARQFITNETVSQCPAALLYADRSSTGECEPSKLLPWPRSYAEHTSTFLLNQPLDDSERDENVVGIGEALFDLVNGFFENLGGRKEPANKYEGTVDARRYMENPEVTSNLTHWLVGGLGTALYGGTFWPLKDSDYPDPDVARCETLRQGNQMINSVADTTTPDINAQAVAGFTNMLRQPVNPGNPQSLENIYLTIDKLSPVCIMEDGTLIRLYQIRPPQLWESYYSRMTEQDKMNFCETQGMPLNECLQELPSYTTCTPGEDGCRYILGPEYTPYSAIAKAKLGGSGGTEKWQQNTTRGDSYDNIAGDRSYRTIFFIHNDTRTYEIERHKASANKPTTPSVGRNFSKPTVVALTEPESIVEMVPEGGLGKPGLMALAPVTGVKETIQETTVKSAHKSMKGFDHCIHADQDGYKMMDIQGIPPLKYPGTNPGASPDFQSGQSAANFNVESCTPTMVNGVPGADCNSETNPIDFYQVPDIRTLIGSIIGALFEIFSRFVRPDETTCTVTAPPVECTKEEHGEACNCVQECEWQCIVACLETCDLGIGCDSYCWNECCEDECTMTGPDVYSCDGVVDTAEFYMVSQTQDQDLSGAIDTANGIAAMILPPYLLEKGEFGLRENMCVVDSYIGRTDEFSSEDSIGIERDCGENTSVMEAARQAVTVPGSNRL